MRSTARAAHSAAGRSTAGGGATEAACAAQHSAACAARRSTGPAPPHLQARQAVALRLQRGEELLELCIHLGRQRLFFFVLRGGVDSSGCNRLTGRMHLCRSWHQPAGTSERN